MVVKVVLELSQCIPKRSGIAAVGFKSFERAESVIAHNRAHLLVCQELSLARFCPPQLLGVIALLHFLSSQCANNA
ncbi:hypothetical protein D9M69_665560 [compost metagenome]